MDNLTLKTNSRGTKYLQDVAGNVKEKVCTDCKEMRKLA